MSKQDPWFFKERSFAFASLLLTEHNDVIIRPQDGTDLAVDLLAEIRKDGLSTLRFFGVQIIPFRDLPDIQEANERVLARLRGDPLEAAFPIGVFVIGVSKPEGIWRWVVEPVVEEGQARLRRDVNDSLQPLDQAEADRLIAQVNAWYDALNGTPTPKRRHRQVKAES
jgi:hypothetical protein